MLCGVLDVVDDALICSTHLARPLLLVWHPQVRAPDSKGFRSHVASRTGTLGGATRARSRS
jgi:hypothetical protein